MKVDITKVYDITLPSKRTIIAQWESYPDPLENEKQGIWIATLRDWTHNPSSIPEDIVEALIKSAESVIITHRTMPDYVFAPFTIFNQTRNVMVVTYTNGKEDITPKDKWDFTLWVERQEDWYALMNADYKDSTVRIVTREEWLRSGVIE